MHYLGYVYGPKDKETLMRIMAPYNEQEEYGVTLGPELVVLSNIPTMTLETSLFDMIVAFREIDRPFFSRASPILIVESLADYELSQVRELGAFVIAYDLDSKEATAKMAVTRAFWDWWVVGGRWPIQFEGKNSASGWNMYKNIISEAEVSWAVDKEALEEKKANRFTSLRMGEIDWKKAKQERVTYALEAWDFANKHLSELPRISDLVTKMNLPKGTRYVDFKHDEVSAWQKRVAEVTHALRPDDWEKMFSIRDVVGMTRREVIRYALLRTHLPLFGIFWEQKYDSDKRGMVEETTVYDFSWATFPTDKDAKDILRRVRNLDPSTVVTAIDIHN